MEGGAFFSSDHPQKQQPQIKGHCTLIAQVTTKDNISGSQTLDGFKSDAPAVRRSGAQEQYFCQLKQWEKRNKTLQMFSPPLPPLIYATRRMQRT